MRHTRAYPNVVHSVLGVVAKRYCLCHSIVTRLQACAFTVGAPSKSRRIRKDSRARCRPGARCGHFLIVSTFVPGTAYRKRIGITVNTSHSRRLQCEDNAVHRVTGLILLGHSQLELLVFVDIDTLYREIAFTSHDYFIATCACKVNRRYSSVSVAIGNY